MLDGQQVVVAAAVHVLLVQGVAHGVALGGAGAPRVSWRPQVSATMVSIGRPSLLISTEPVVR
jgi:hypothetical protein